MNPIKYFSLAAMGEKQSKGCGFHAHTLFYVFFLVLLYRRNSTYIVCDCFFFFRVLGYYFFPSLPHLVDPCFIHQLFIQFGLFLSHAYSYTKLPEEQ